jgi:ribosomal protein S16
LPPTLLVGPSLPHAGPLSSPNVHCNVLHCHASNPSSRRQHHQSWSSAFAWRASAGADSPSSTLSSHTQGTFSGVLHCRTLEIGFFSDILLFLRTARNSKPLEVLGTYNPVPQKPKDGEGRQFKDVQLDLSRAKYWIGVGAQPSDSAWRLLSMVSSGGRRQASEKQQSLM